MISNPNSTPSSADASRFWAHVAKTRAADCWNWTASLNPQGYGQFQTCGRCCLAPRVAYALAHGQWPAGIVYHSCDNPACVNPAHLWVGTQAENMRDMKEKGRSKAKLTHCKNGHPLSAKNLAPSKGQRRCLTCKREAGVRRYYRITAGQKRFARYGWEGKSLTIGEIAKITGNHASSIHRHMARTGGTPLDAVHALSSRRGDGARYGA